MGRRPAGGEQSRLRARGYLEAVTAPPETRYAETPNGHVAYQVVGEGPPLLLVSSWAQNIDAMWDEPRLVHFLSRLAGFSTLVCFDKRGSGVSDPVPLSHLPTLEQWMDDAVVVLDATGVGPAAVIGDTEGGPMAMLLAASAPDRVRSLVLLNTYARFRRDADYPIGMPDSAYGRLLDAYAASWGKTGAILEQTAPTAARDSAFGTWFTRYQRLAMPPTASRTMYGWVTSLDIRPILADIRVPTRVIHRRDARHHRAEFGRFLAATIAAADYVELEGADTFPMQAGDNEPVLHAIEEFVTGARPTTPSNRRLATIVVTDLVGSTALAAASGDAAWLRLLQHHDQVVRAHLATYRGLEVNTTGDGFVASFDGPGRAVTFAVRLAAALGRIGLRMRAGVHTGEIEENDGVVGGLAVHIAARVMALAAEGGVVASATVRDLVMGSGIEFAAGEDHDLKGVPGTWGVHRVLGAP